MEYGTTTGDSNELAYLDLQHLIQSSQINSL